MKILQVMAGAEHGGAETAFVDMCIAMHEAGEHIEVVTRPNDIRVPQMQDAGLVVHTLPFGGKVDVFTRWRMQKIIKDFEPDIVQSWMCRAPLKVPRWRKSMGVKRYYHVSRLGSPYKMKYFKNTDCFISITPGIADHIAAHGIARDRIRHINNFAEIERGDTPINRADYGTPENAPLLLGLGRLHEDKAFDTLIKVAAEMPDVHVWIAGEGPDRVKLEALIEELNVGARVKLLGWRTDREALLEAADICTFISRDEGFGTVFVQSWLMGTPVVVCDADGPKQFVRHGEDGMMAPIDDVEAIKDCIQKILDDDNLRDRLIKNGRARYEAEFTKAASVSGYLAFYHHIINSK